MKKWLSRVVDVVLGVFIALVVLLQVDLLITKQSNHGVPSVFGYSFMEVLTDSMDGGREDSFAAGDGIIIEKRDASSIMPDDIITFYSPSLSSSAGSDVVVSHRVSEVVVPPSEENGEGSVYVTSRAEYRSDLNAEYKAAISDKAIPLSAGERLYVHMIDDESSSYLTYTMPAYAASNETTFYACGDNLDAEWYTETTGHSVSPTYRDTVLSSNVIGVVISHSAVLGGFLSIFQSAWFVPVCVLAPLLIIATISLIDFIRKTRAEAKAEDEAIKNEMLAAGIDPNDEAAVLMFTEKARYRHEIEEELEKEKKKEIKRQRKLLKKGWQE